MSSLTTAIDILHRFSAERPELRVSDIARDLDIPKSTVSRLLKEMLRHGLVEQNVHTRLYRPGPLAFRLGSLYQAHLKILDLVEAAIEQLVGQLGLTGYIGVLDGADVVILRVRQGSYPVRFILEAGYRVPAFTTAIGKALLARLSDTAVAELHPEVLRYEVTDLALSRDDLLGSLRAIRRCGWAEAVETTFSGFGAVAAAVGAADGQQALGFCLSYPTNSPFADQKPAMVERVLQAADQIGRRAGDLYWLNRDDGPMRLSEGGEPSLIEQRVAT